MPASTEIDTLKPLLDTALQGQPGALETYLVANSHLPGPCMNTALATAFAALVGDLVIQPNPPVEALEKLLDGWAALSLAGAPVNQPREILPATAVLTYGQVAIRRPDWWPDEIAKLRRAAADPRWRTREMVATALQAMLKADWPRTCAALTDDWLNDLNPLVIRAAAAAIAEPPLLKTAEQSAQAVQIQQKALDFLLHIPLEKRSEESVRVLRQALGYTISVAVAAAPEIGLPWLRDLSKSPDPDVQWIVRENWKKTRLKKYQA